MAEFVYDQAKLRWAQGSEPWGTGDYRAILLTTDDDTTTYTTVADLKAGTGVEPTGEGTYGEVALTGEAAALDTGVAELTANTIDFTTLDNVTPVAMVIIRFVDGTDANDLLISHHDTNFGAAANGAGYTVTIGANGLIRFA